MDDLLYLGSRTLDLLNGLDIHSRQQTFYHLIQAVFAHKLPEGGGGHHQAGGYLNYCGYRAVNVRAFDNMGGQAHGVIRT
jgi:hypothetical protein